MKKTFVYAFAAVVVLFVAACAGNKKSEVATPALQGNYEAMLPAADAPGIFVRLALNDSTYQLFEKYIDKDGVFVTTGTVKDLTEKGFTVADGMQIELTDSTLATQGVTFTKVSNEMQLPKAYTMTYLKGLKTGTDAELALATVDGTKQAVLSLEGKNYTLKAGEGDSYTDGKVTLTLKDDKYTVSGADKNDDFVVIAPVWNRYQSTPDASQMGVETMFFEEEGKGYIRLFTDNLNRCYILNRTEASAKTATFTDGKVTWSTANDNTATLSEEGKTVKFTRSAK